MFKILSLKENIKNLAKLSKPYLSLNSTEGLKQAYCKFLEIAQPSVPQNKYAFEEMSYLYEAKDIEKLLHVFEEKSALDDFETIFDDEKTTEQKMALERIKGSLLRLKNDLPEYYYLINLVINTIFAAPSKLAGGGSTSAAIGCIWVNLRPHWEEQDVTEFLIHETTHNLVFIDELCYGHYNDYSFLPLEVNFAWSAILGKLRPIDKVFHSIIVSTEVLLYREFHDLHQKKTCLHPPSAIMLDQTLYSIDYLMQSSQLKSLLSERSLYLLNFCQNELQKIGRLACAI